MTTNRAVIASIALLAGAVALAPSTASATARVVHEIDGSHHDWVLARCPVRDPQTRHRAETTGRQKYRRTPVRRCGRDIRNRFGNLFDFGVGVRGLRSSGRWTGLGSLANRLPSSSVMFWLTNGLRPGLVHPARLWLKRGLRCR